MHGPPHVSAEGRVSSDEAGHQSTDLRAGRSRITDPRLRGALEALADLIAAKVLEKGSASLPVLATGEPPEPQDATSPGQSEAESSRQSVPET